MNNRPTTMNNRQPAGSRDCEQHIGLTRVASTSVETRTNKVLPGMPVPGFIRGPILSGAVFAADQCRKPPRTR